MISIELVSEIFDLCVIPLLIVLTRYLINFIHVKANEIKAKTEIDTQKKYIEMIENTIITCVQATNQTYVESLKKQGKFDKEAQIEAFKSTYDSVMKILSEDAIEYINSTTGDVGTYLTELIEAKVNEAK